VVALEFLEYLATTPSLRQNFHSVVSEKTSKNSDYAFPFVKATIQMIKYICNMLEIGVSSEEEDESVNTKSKLQKQNEILFIMFTVNNDGIFEFFGKCLWLFNRLWIEMKAQSLDFDRVKNLFGYLQNLLVNYYKLKTNIFDPIKALTALKDSLYKILSDINKTEQNGSTDLGQSSIVRRKLIDFNSLIESWKYDFIKNTKNRFDKTTLLPIK
jgi:hypothetical protein